ncbi:putative RNA-directed DNA polymerase from transposon X-element [Trichonephila clavipes]|nr:putative RNA-directed DNA polymerase from transposon X-element [Trichonephila clavipes]
MSALESLHFSTSTIPTVIEHLTSSPAKIENFHIIFSWVPGHVGILGNEQADTAARSISDHMQPTCLLRGISGFLHRTIFIVYGKRLGIKASLYVDDLQISCDSSDMRMIERQLQTAINNILKWCDTNGHSISASKSCCVHFAATGNSSDLEIRIRAVSDKFRKGKFPLVRFLRVIFDRRLIFLPCIFLFAEEV